MTSQLSKDGDPLAPASGSPERATKGRRLGGGPAHVPVLDGVRGLAILLVLLIHFRISTGTVAFDRILNRVELPGYTGVDLFFVLSGYLITGILLDARCATQHYFRNFYARRAVRILPLYYGVVAFLIVVLPVLHRPTEALQAVQRDQWWYWLHATNIFIARGGELPYNTRHFWSLAVEEQFYLLWPVIVWLLPPPRLVRVCVMCAIVAPVLRLLCDLAGQQEWAIALTPMRMDTLALGALLAARARIPDGMRSIVLWAPWVGSIAMVVLAITYVGSQYSPSWQIVHDTLGFSATALGFASLLVLVTRGSQRSVFAHPALRSFGKYSYGIYVFHWPLLLFASPLYAAVAVLPLVYGSFVLRQIAFFSVATAVSVGVAWLSWHLYEQHFLALKRFFPYRESRPVPVESAAPVLAELTG
jgi:peptidoglycan/LPS O-acetylase OafA/YrhL